MLEGVIDGFGSSSEDFVQGRGCQGMTRLKSGCELKTFEWFFEGKLLRHHGNVFLIFFCVEFAIYHSLLIQALRNTRICVKCRCIFELLWLFPDRDGTSLHIWSSKRYKDRSLIWRSM